MYLLGNWVSPEEGTKNIIKRKQEEKVRGMEYSKNYYQLILRFKKHG